MKQLNSEKPQILLTNILVFKMLGILGYGEASVGKGQKIYWSGQESGSGVATELKIMVKIVIFL